MFRVSATDPRFDLSDDVRKAIINRLPMLEKKKEAGTLTPKEAKELEKLQKIVELTEKTTLG